MAYNPVAQVEDDPLSDSEYSHLVPSLFEQYDQRGRRSPKLEFQSKSSYSGAMDQQPKTVSREGSVLRHPTPDLHSLQGAYASNIERLEQSAERLSLSSSGIGEELRKLRMEQRQSDSRRSSVMSSPMKEDEQSPVPMNRQTSFGYGSHASNSIVGTNSIARSGGFSPAAYYASPRGSVLSGSWSQHEAVKDRSASYGPRLRQVSEPEQEGKPLDSPLSSRLVPILPEPEPTTNALRVINNESYNLDDVEIPHTQSAVSELPDIDQEPRPSTDTYRQASSLFADFDGVHTEYHSDNGQAEPGKIIGSRKARTSRPASRIMSYMEPIPGENMVYYPAPVPMMLNLPKRLSKLPSGAEREKRRTQLLESLPQEARKSAPWLPDTMGESDEGMQAGDDSMPHTRASKRRTTMNIPPQLRATMFFDQTVPHDDVELKGESAVATLDSILDASAFAPVSAFTDHPFAGRAGAEIYGREATRPRSSMMAPSQKRRSTINLLSRRSSMDLLDDGKKSPNVLRKRNSNTTLLENTGRRNSSPLSLGKFSKGISNGQQLEHAEENQEGEAAEGQDEETPLQTPTEDSQVIAAEEAYFHDAPEDKTEENGEDTQQPDDFIGAPTTLLAELHLRKQQQKLRNRTAATAFPNGMHSTLLQLDAVDQIQKQKRKQKHTQLAWEDPNAQHAGIENEDDEDVPLGMLFAGRKLDVQEKARRMDEDRPLGLIDKREMEDNEPLSHRRARLRGEDPIARNPSPDKRMSAYTLDLPYLGDPNLTPEPHEIENDNEDETLGQRLRRLKATQIPIQPRPVSGDFASDMMSQLGAPSPAEPFPPVHELAATARATTKTPDPEETLGQRRRRLHNEAANMATENTDTNDQPPPSKRRSMADILQAHPAAGAGSKPAMRALSNEIKFAPAPRTRNTSWAINQSRQASMGVGLPMASGIGSPNAAYSKLVGMNGGGVLPHPMVQQQMEVDTGRRDMIDRWRQSIHY